MSNSVGIERIASILKCPTCDASLEVSGGVLRCPGNGDTYPMQEGIPLLVPTDRERAQPAAKESQTSESYQANYQQVERAKRYNEKYQKQPTKRASTKREGELIRTLLSSQPKSGILLELPSGGGRLSPELEPFADLIVEADIAVGQVLYGRSTSTLKIPQVWMQASAFNIPLKDKSVDGTFCCRLCHHLPSPTERERLLRELLRVSKRFVLMTFFDHDSLKNRLRRMRKVIDNKKPKMTMTVSRVRELANESGFDLVAAPHLSRVFSGHRYALMVRR